VDKNVASNSNLTSPFFALHRMFESSTVPLSTPHLRSRTSPVTTAKTSLARTVDSCNVRPPSSIPLARFLALTSLFTPSSQAPDGEVTKGSRRRYTDNVAVSHLQRQLSQGKECQASLINYRKGGVPFINLVTVIPIPWDSDEIVFHVGFQVCPAFRSCLPSSSKADETRN
jgi:hypothetical protein